MCEGISLVSTGLCTKTKEQSFQLSQTVRFNQAREFNETVPLTGLVLTKLDGTARGGAVVGVVDDLKLPIKFVGVGETVDDLQPFNATSFVEGLFPDTTPS